MQNLSGGTRFKCYPGPFSSVSYRWGDKLLPDGVTLRNKDSFIYGGAVTLELETYLSDKVVLLLNARERAVWGSSIGHFHLTFGAGIKFIIN